ncbi:MAG: bifunctional nuclease family protein [Dehalococcoidia bacterium]
MTVESILVSSANDSRIVLLKEGDGERYLPVFVGTAEANAIALRMENIDPPRPLTHDLIKLTFESLGASVDQVVVTELRDDVFYGSLIFRQQGQQFSVDSRPSDCIAIALRFDAPIFVNEPVLDEAAMGVDPQTGYLRPYEELATIEHAGDKAEEMPPAFREVIEDLDMGDIDKKEE